MRIGSSTFSSQVILRMKNTQARVQKQLERLSSGKRINRASDDVAGFARANGLEASVRGSRQAIQNINTALARLNTKEAALRSQSDIVQRMRELAVQGANGLLSSDQRAFLNEELQSLYQEFSRILDETTFNGEQLFKASEESLTIQIGSNSSSSLQLEEDTHSISDVFTKSVGTKTFALNQELEGLPTDFSVFGNELSAFGDLNGDGYEDAVVLMAYLNTDVEFKRTTFVAYGSASGFSDFETLENANIVGGSDLHLTDVNQDGIDDILTNETIYLNNGDGNFSAQSTFYQTSSSIYADLNEDGVDDILNVGGGGNVDVLLSDGDGGYEEGDSLATGTGVSGFPNQVSDVNNDGHLDVLINGISSANSQLFLGNGDGSFSFAGTLATSPSTAGDQNLLGDLDGDGNVDLFAKDTASSDFFVRFGNGDGSFGSTQTYNTQGIYGSRPQVVDFDQDGDDELVFFDESEGFVQVADFEDDQLKLRQEFEASPTGDFNFSIADINDDGILDFNLLDGENIKLQNFSQYSQEESAISDMQISDQESAQELIGILDNALDNIQTQQSKVGVQIQRLERAAGLNQLQTEYLELNRSQTEDVNLAEAAADLLSTQVLQQAQVAAFSQSKIQMALVLELFRS